MICNFISAKKFTRERDSFPNSKVVFHSKITANIKRFILHNQLSLFHKHKGTNFIYKLTKPNTLRFDVGRFNIETLIQSKISVRLTRLENSGF